MEPKYHKVIGASTSGGVTFYELEHNPTTLDKAACAGIDTEMFYPDRYVFSREQGRFYDELCAQCPVVEACLEWALCHEPQGIWGGTTPAERKYYREALKWGLSDLTIGSMPA
jgi:WhiB family redox-sensing transcriptional regulator